MAVTPLTATQRSAIEALVDGRRLEAVPVDEPRAAAFVANAVERLSQVPLLTSPRVQYDLSYDAAHDLGEALLAGYGYRTRATAGQHEAVGRFLRAALDAPPGERAALAFDRLRRTRNQSHYSARAVGAAEAEFAESTARELLDAVRERGITATEARDDGRRTGPDR